MMLTSDFLRNRIQLKPRDGTRKTRDGNFVSIGQTNYIFFKDAGNLTLIYANPPNKDIIKWLPAILTLLLAPNGDQDQTPTRCRIVSILFTFSGDYM